jgi:hypothetical protein
LLALAYRSGLRPNGISGAIDGIAEWLCLNRYDDDWGINWPTSVMIQRSEDGNDSLTASASGSGPFGPSRTAWCYGAPGIARALWLAGEALHCARYRSLAIDAMEAVYRRPIPERKIDSPTFCHGVSGLLQITLRFGADTELPVFHEAALLLYSQLLDLYRPETLLGYYCLEPGGKRVDQLGLLDGAMGILVTLLAARGGAEPAWDRLFLLS